jgi:hypothetical protein
MESNRCTWSTVAGLFLCIAGAFTSAAGAADPQIRSLIADSRPSLRDLKNAGFGLEPLSSREVARCGTMAPDPKDSALIERDFSAYLRAQSSPEARATARVVKVVFLVIHDGPKGFLSLQDLYNQIDVLNAAYAGSAVQFQLYNAFQADAPDWFHFRQGSDEERAAKAALDGAGYGSTSFLRIYTLLPEDADGGSLLGFATFPWDLARNAKLDGVALDYTTFPGGAAPYDQGLTATHEVGHWLGLYHTFQGGCRGAGDSVKDTPPEAEPAFQCPVGRDTCPGGGVDPIHNFMDYSDDPCLSQFTNGQRTRFKGMVSRYRGRLL